jgi:hypothetical protein
MKHLLKIFFSILLCLSAKSYAQFLYLQDTYKGGISMDGKSYSGESYLASDTINFINTVPTGSTIKKAFLVSDRYFFNITNPNPTDNPVKFLFNSDTITIDSTNILSSFRCDNSSAGDHGWLVVKDVTAYTLFNSNQLITPCQGCSITANPNWNYVYCGFLLVILYENNVMPATNAAIFLNDRTFFSTMTYHFNNLNPVNTTNDAGLSVWVDNTNKPDSVGITLNTSYLGAIYSLNANLVNSAETTLPGSFYYQNNTLFGLRDDTPNSTFDSTDALANIKSYIPNNTTNFNLMANLTTDPGCKNVVSAFILAYSSPCPARGTTPAQSYTLCNNSSLCKAGCFITYILVKNPYLERKYCSIKLMGKSIPTHPKLILMVIK